MADDAVRRGLVEGLEEAHRLEKEMDAHDTAEDAKRLDAVADRLADASQQHERDV